MTTQKSGKSWATNLSPIGGVYGGAAAEVAFKGTFDGNGKTISNLQINNKADGSTLTDAKAANAGLFALLDGATVKDLTVKVTKIEAVGKNGFVGVIAAQSVNNTVIADCVVEADATATGNFIQSLKSGATFGGIVANAADTVIDSCTANLKVKGQGVTAGIVGIATDSVVRNSVASGSYEHGAASALAGIAGELVGESAVENCYSAATLKSAIASDVVGGVAAKVGADASVENCFSAAAVSATGTQTSFGVLVGVNDGTVAYAYALRDESAGGEVFLTAHNVIGAGNGTSTEVYAYQPKTEGDEVVFVVGTVVKTENAACHTVAGSECSEAAHNTQCSLCGGDGILQAMYSFVPASSDIGSLVDALNNWVSDQAGSGVAYASWIVVGDTITNCSHGATVYKNVSLKATCSTTGIGDKHCAVCDTLLEAGATIPVDTINGHQGKEYACLAYDCTLCGEHFDATLKHEIGNKHCVNQACVKCGTIVEATEAHKNPAPDADKPCAEYECSVCGETTHDHDHDITEAEFACQDAICSVCGYVAQKGSAHRPGRAPTCTKNQECLVCGVEIRPMKAHVPGALSTCGTAQKCQNCPYIFVPAGQDADGNILEHTWNRDAAYCTEDKFCKTCGLVDEKRTGHDMHQDDVVDCGHGRACHTCHVIVDPAVGEHTVDWSTATVVRPATVDRTGIVVAICSGCGREVEAYTSCVAMEEEGNALVAGGSFTFYAGTHVKAEFGKVADYKSIAYANGYLPLQVVTLSVLDASGANLSISGGITVKVVLNNSAAQMALETLKLYSVKDGVATEITITAQEDGYITFTADALGTFVLAGEKTAAFTVLGTLPVQAQQTASLIGTASYERRDFEI